MDNELKSGFGEDITYDSSLGSSNDKDSGATVFQNVAMNENAAKANMQSNDLRRLIAEYPEKINQSVLRKGTTIPKQASADTLKGFVFEKHAALSTEIDSVANGNPIWKVQVFTDGLLPDGTVLTGIDKSEDLVAFVKEHFWSKPVKTDSGQFKTHSNNNRIAYKIEARNQNYQGQQMIGSTNAPKDLFKTSFEVHLKGGKTVKSDPIDDETLKQMAEQAKKQNAPEYAHADEKIKRMNEVNMQNAIKAGAFAGLAISTIKEICTVIAHKDELPEDQFLISVQNILCGTIEGGVRSGAIVGSMQIAEKILGRSLSAGEAVLPMALANVAVDFSKDLYACFVTKQIDTDDLLCNTIDNTYSSVAGFGGGYIGGQAGASIFTSIATSTKIGAALGSAAGPLGTVVGTVVGGLLIGCAVQGVIGVANKDAAKAFQESLDKINSNESFTGYDKMFYFADEMGSLSEFKLSFKCLLPCYNLISDMREYNMRKKAMNNIRAQLEYMYIDSLFRDSSRTFFLDTQYRMCNEIGTLISENFYDGKLKNGRNESIPDSVVWISYNPSRGWPVFEKDNVHPKIYNDDEVEIIAGVLHTLDEGVMQKDVSVAVISPYKYQVKRLRDRLKDEEYNYLTVEVNTVDAFQGKERDIVFFSITRTQGSARFFADPRRLNVALSRARDRLFIVGNHEFIESKRNGKNAAEVLYNIFNKSHQLLATVSDVQSQDEYDEDIE